MMTGVFTFFGISCAVIALAAVMAAMIAEIIATFINQLK